MFMLSFKLDNTETMDNGFSNEKKSNKLILRAIRLREIRLK